jgi:predicted DNA-binding protein (MmcQ/YjbR family)
MDLETVREYCLRKKGVTEDRPFGEDILALRVMNKIFALIPMEAIPLSINLKCDPELAIELRDRFEGVLPGYHQNKKHWNTVMLDGSVPDRDVREMIDHSYELIIKGLKKTERQQLAAM